MRNKYFLLTFLLVIVKINCQVETVPTAGPTTVTVPSAPTVTSTQTPQPTCPPTGIHHFPTENCQDFIVCIYGREHLGSCAKGFLFDPVTSSCLTADVVDCELRIRP